MRSRSRRRARGGTASQTVVRVPTRKDPTKYGDSAVVVSKQKRGVGGAWQANKTKKKGMCNIM